MGILIRIGLILFGVWIGFQLRGDVDQMKRDKKEFRESVPQNTKFDKTKFL